MVTLASCHHMQTNLRFGCVILRHYLDRERGDLSWRWGATTVAGASRPTQCGVCRAAKLDL